MPIDGGGGALESQVVDSVGRNERDRDVIAVQEEPAELNLPVFEQRRVDLTRFAHKGEWSYRMRAVFGEDVKTAPSNVEIARVTG